MRKSILVFLTLLFGISCKKDHNEETPVADAFAMYIRNGAGDAELWYSLQDGSSFTKIATGPLGQDFNSSPAWSGNGKTIYFTRNTANENENGIYSIRPNGDDLKTIYKDQVGQRRNFSQLVTSSNDEWMVYSLEIERAGRKVVELFKMCPCGAQNLRFTTFETANGSAPSGTESYAGSFSADEEYLFFSQAYPSPNTLKDINIYRMKIATGELNLIKTVQAADILGTVPSISPDGQKIVFSIDKLIHVMNSDGSNLMPLSSIEGFRPQWGPNSQDIYFSSLDVPGLASGLYKTDINGTDPSMVSKNSSVGMYGGFASNNN